MVVIQRVLVRWDARHRGAADANVRRALPDVHPLPQLSRHSDASFVLHDVAAHEHTGYWPVATVRTASVPGALADLWVERVDGVVMVGRTQYPGGPRAPGRLLRLAPGQRGRYRANRRLAGTCCGRIWEFEQCVVHVADPPAGVPVLAELFLDGQYHQDVDRRESLY